GFRIPQMLNSIQSGAAAYARLRPLLAPPLPMAGQPALASFRPSQLVEPLPPTAAPCPPAGPLAVRFEHVTFRYPGAAQPALQDICLDLPAGTLVAVTGPVGAGKS